MHASRGILVVAVLSVLTALTSCSGSDSDPATAGPSVSPRSPSASSGADKTFQRDCAVRVEVSGAVRATWHGTGSVSNQDGPTAYRFTHGGDELVLYAAQGDAPGSANLSIGRNTYTATESARGFDVADVAEDGTAAHVDAKTVGVDGTGPRLVATFDCPEGSGKG